MPVSEVRLYGDPDQAQGGREELLGGFISLVTMFAGRLCGMRSAAARKWLLAESDGCPPGGGR